MDSITIYRAGQPLETIKPEDNSVQAKRIMGENELRLAFRMNHCTHFNINDYCTVFGELYKVNALPQVDKRSRFLYEYNLTMQAEGFDLAKAQFLLFNELEFSLTADSDMFIDLILSNALRVSSGWIKGQVIPTTRKTLTFKAVNCLDALKMIAEVFETEFSIEGKTIHLTARSNDRGLTFEHGRRKGLYEITRTNIETSNLVTRLYAVGSEKNLPQDYRGGGVTRLKMPHYERPGFTLPNGVIVPPKIEQGNYIELNIGKYGAIEGALIFEDVFPHRTGTINSVDATNFYKFTDESIDFDINAQLIPGISAKVSFTSGQLAGYTLEIEAFDYNTKEIIVLKNKDEQALDIPSATIKPAIGDQYVLVDIIMPMSYVYSAEEALKNRALSALAIACEPQVQYTLVTDPVYLRNKSLSLNIGDMLWIVDDELEIRRQIRIVSALRNIVQEFSYTIELSDVVSIGIIAQLQRAIATQRIGLVTITRQVSSLSQNNLTSLPITPGSTGFSPVYIDDATGRLYRRP